jgi:circadian clock protein KaiC
MAMEQSPDELLRNMKAIGLPLKRHLSDDLLRFHALRPTAHGLELHLTNMHQMVEEFKPRVVVVDAISSFIGMGAGAEVTSMIVRLIDFLKAKQITLYMTSFNESSESMDRAGANISSIVDTWLLLRNLETNAARVRTLSVIKSRGMPHSSATQEFAITHRGIVLKAPLTSQATP